MGVTMNWMLTDINILTAVADDMERLCSEKQRELDLHDGFSCPGQHWADYRSQKYLESDAEKDLRQRLVELLTLSTTQEELDMLPRGKNKYCPHLRFKQKKMDLAEWLVDGKMHNGAHFPLCVFTHNASGRSKEKAMERASKQKETYGKGGKSKGKGREQSSAVAAGSSTPSGIPYPDRDDYTWTDDYGNSWSF